MDSIASFICTRFGKYLWDNFDFEFELLTNGIWWILQNDSIVIGFPQEYNLKGARLNEGKAKLFLDSLELRRYISWKYRFWMEVKSNLGNYSEFLPKNLAIHLV